MRIDEIRVDVSYDPDTTPRRTRIAVHLPAGLSEDQVRRLARVAETCPVKRALEAGFEFEQTVTAGTETALNAPPPAAAAAAR